MSIVYFVKNMAHLYKKYELIISLNARTELVSQEKQVQTNKSQIRLLL